MAPHMSRDEGSQQLLHERDDEAGQLLNDRREDDRQPLLGDSLTSPLRGNAEDRGFPADPLGVQTKAGATGNSGESSGFVTALLIVSWYTSNIGVIMLNKYLLSFYGFK